MPYMETWTNQAQTTVATGGTAALSQGTSEQWTVGSSATFPVASLSSVPHAGFHVADIAATSEIIAVTAVTSTVWGVTRGAENTTPVTHATGFTIQQVVTAGGLQTFGQLEMTGSTVATTVAASTALGTLATYVPPATDVPAAGVVYDVNIFGTIWNTTNAFTIAATWNGTTLASMISTTNGTVPATLSTSPFWLEGHVNCWGATTMVAGMNFQSFVPAASHTIATLVGASTAGVTTSGTAGPLSIILTTGAAGSVHTAGWLIHRVS